MTSIKIQLLEYIRRHPGCSYVELERFFDEIGFEWRGEMAVVNSDNQHVVFWTGWNQEATDVVSELEATKQVLKKPVERLIYLLDGRSLTLPVAKTNRIYKTDHWLPVVFSVPQKSV